MQRAGYEQLGIAYELRPQRARMCVLILPYEMQISADAAAKYASLGFSWEDGFLQGSPQKMLAQAMRRKGRQRV